MGSLSWFVEKVANNTGRAQLYLNDVLYVGVPLPVVLSVTRFLYGT